MHETGEKTLAALRQLHPGHTIEARETDYGNMFCVAVQHVDGRPRFGVHTPPTVDYRRWGYQELLHRINTIIAPKLETRP